MFSNAAIEEIKKFYDMDHETFIECIANACRKLYGIIDIWKISDDTVHAYSLCPKGSLKQKDIKITRSGMDRIVKETIRQIEGVQNEEHGTLKALSFKSALALLSSDIQTISKSDVEFRVIGERAPTPADRKKDPKAELFVIVRASRYMSPAEIKYFSLKSPNIKKGIRFVLD